VLADVAYETVVHAAPSDFVWLVVVDGGTASERRVVTRNDAAVVIDHTDEIVDGVARSYRLRQVRRQIQTPGRKVNFLIDFIPPEEIAEREAFELNRQDIRKAPQRHLLRRLSVLLTLRTVPGLFVAQHFRLHKLLQAAMQRHSVGISLMLRCGGRVQLAVHHLLLDDTAVLRRVLIIPPIQRQAVDILHIQQLIASILEPLLAWNTLTHVIHGSDEKHRPVHLLIAVIVAAGYACRLDEKSGRESQHRLVDVVVSELGPRQTDDEGMRCDDGFRAAIWTVHIPVISLTRPIAIGNVQTFDAALQLDSVRVLSLAGSTVRVLHRRHQQPLNDGDVDGGASGTRC